MKILVLFNAGFGDSISGGDVHILNVIEELSEKAEVFVTVPKDAREICTRLNQLKKVKKIFLKDYKKINGKFGLVQSYFSRARQAFKIVDGGDFDLVISSTPFFCDTLPLKKIPLKTKVVSYIFHTLPKRKVKSFKDRLINFLTITQEKRSLRIIKRKADLVFTCNAEEKRILRKRLGGKQVEIAGIGINTSSFNGSLKKKKDSALFIGRLVKQKGIFDLVDIIKEIKKHNPKIKLEIVGEGPDRKELEIKIKKEGLERNIVLSGFVDEERKTNLLKNSEYFFFPSYEEGFGIVIAEALYAKCKVICYKLPHYKEFFSSFPEYIPLGDKVLFSKRYQIKRDLVAQRKYVSKFDSTKLVAKEVKKILNVA